MNTRDFPRLSLAHLPTPLEPMDRLSTALGGPRLFVKRDDCTGLALGGNKTRKLEFLLADAVGKGADTIITAGGYQSNHVRQTAAAASRLGLRCHLVLQPYVDRYDEAYLGGGNLLLDKLLGAEIHTIAGQDSRDAAMQQLAERLRTKGCAPYVVPGGGANAIGGLGYAAAAAELLHQAAGQDCDIGHIVLASGTGSSQGGLIAGLARLDRDVPVLGIDVDKPAPDVPEQAARIANETADLLGLATTDLGDRVRVVGGYGGDGYGEPSDAMIEAVRLAAQLEGLLLDPVYTGKAMAGLIDLIRRKEISSDRDVVFVHTGGVPGLFAYPSLFSGPMNGNGPSTVR